MNSDQQEQTLNNRALSWAPFAGSALVDYSRIRYSPSFAVSNTSLLPPKSHVLPTPPEYFGLNIEMERSPWSGTDQLQPPPLLLSPYTVQYVEIDTGYAHDPTTAISSLSHNSYSVIQEQFLNAPWRHAGELEPKDPNTGRSVLYRLLEERTEGNKGRISKCCLCDGTFSRADRAITHLRHKHLDHRPYWCEGACGTTGCRQRFYSQENLTPHVKPKMVSCPRCSYKCLRQNLKRHTRKYHSEQLRT